MEQSAKLTALAVLVSILTVLVVIDLGYQLTEEEDTNEPPVADIWASVGSGHKDEISYTTYYKIWLLAGHSFDPEGQPLILNWDFNASNGIHIDSTEAHAEIIFCEVELFKESWGVPNPNYHYEAGLFKYYVPLNATIEVELTVTDGVLMDTEAISVTVPFVR